MFDGADFDLVKRLLTEHIAMAYCVLYLIEKRTKRSGCSAFFNTRAKQRCHRACQFFKSPYPAIII
jgi:hypothetical protein